MLAFSTVSGGGGLRAILQLGLLAVLPGGCQGGPADDASDHDSTDTSTPPTEIPPPGGNILVIVLDDMGLDKIAGYGVTAAPIRTPQIDSLISQGMRFDNVWGLPYCAPSRAALQTGRYARRTGIGTNESILTSQGELDAGQITIPEMVALSPWFTYDNAYVGKWHLSTHQSPSGIDGPHVQGWSWYAGSIGNLDQ